MYFLTRIFQGIKTGLGILGLVASAGVIVFGVVTVVGGSALGYVAIACGVCVFIPSGFMLVDSQKILNDIKIEFDKFKKQLKQFEEQVKEFKTETEKFKNENEQLHTNVVELEETKGLIQQENQKLIQITDENQKQLESLDSIKSKYEEIVQKLDKELKAQTAENQVYATENEELKNNIDELEDLKLQLKQENEHYQQGLERMKTHVETLETLKEQYITENDRLHNIMEEQTGQLSQLSEKNKEQEQQILHLKGALEKSEEQIVALKALVLQLKELYKNLVLAGDMFQDFQETIGQDVEQLDNTTSTLQTTVDLMTNMVDKLNKKLLSSDFKNMDQNQDGTITLDEFEKYINNQ
jgi:chromosome segregation ATPase